MMRRIGNWDVFTLLLYGALVGIGLLTLRSIALAEGGRVGAEVFIRQLGWVIALIPVALLIRAVQSRNIEVFSYPVYVIGVVLLVLPLLMGHEVAGTTAWLHWGPVNLQPAELMKLFTTMAVTHYLTTPGLEWRLRPRVWLWTMLLVGVPMILIFLQNDVGTLLTYTGVYLLLWRKGAPTSLPVLMVIIGGLFLLTLYFSMQWILIGGTVLIVIVSWLAWYRVRWKSLVGALVAWIMLAGVVLGTQYAFDWLKPHQQERILVTIGKKEDPRGQGYNLQQSLIAIGSGGLWGKGYRQGSQTQYGFVPEQHTDFIFTAIAEEWGWMGSVTVLLLYVLLMYRVITLAERSPSEGVCLLGYGYVGFLFVHVVVNLSSVTGLFPIVGIPLPYISYGGSAMLGFSMFLFVFLSMEAHMRLSLR